MRLGLQGVGTEEECRKKQRTARLESPGGRLYPCCGHATRTWVSVPDVARGCSAVAAVFCVATKGQKIGALGLVANGERRWLAMAAD